MTHALDTSAVLAHYFGEPGRVRVHELLEDLQTVVGVSALTLYEIDTRLAVEGLSAMDRRRVLQGYLVWFDEVVSLTPEIAALATALRGEASSRIAAVDCLIAATALSAGAILVHRDAHFAVLSAGSLKQEKLPEKT